ncbi:MAG: DUF2189 domain-containing protein [Bacteroidales bacterium]
MHTAFVGEHAHPIRLRSISLDHPWRWLAAGWFDMCCEPAVSYSYGAIFTALGLMLFFGLDQWGLAAVILPLGMGFALVGPVAAVGLYEVSRRLARGDAISFAHLLGALRRNPSQIALVGLFLVLALLAWVRLAMLEFMLFFGAQPPALGHLFDALISTSAGVALLLVGTASGAVLALAVFAMAAIAVPMLVDRPDCDAMTAMLTSVEALRRNFRPMMLWAFLIGLFTLAGAGLFLVGLVVVLPLLGHASWHAYTDLVERGP